ncbi:hypothetical protein LNO81_13860 [Klebsiella variicola subsp. variicola]|nr:hypothetical protein [Klebsiella variicola subsp. variicola]
MISPAIVPVQAPAAKDSAGVKEWQTRIKYIESWISDLYQRGMLSLTGDETAG